MIWLGKMLMFLRNRHNGDERPKPDPARGQLITAIQRNESAGERARAALMEVLSSSDEARGVPRQ